MDLRIQKTKAAIKEAFFELRRKKPIEKITVTELSRLAGINKATFYLHYSDIYSLAATLYHLATGRLLFPNRDNDNMMRAHCDELTQATDPRAFRPELSEGFAQLLESMLVKNRDYRVSSWRDVYAMCREVEIGSNFKPRDTTNANSSIKLMMN